MRRLLVARKVIRETEYPVDSGAQSHPACQQPSRPEEDSVRNCTQRSFVLNLL
jgi:hypothetical protein